MAKIKKEISVVSSIEGDEELWFVRLDLIYGEEIISTLEFAEITEEINDLITVNKELSIYENEEDIRTDLAEGHLNKFLKIEHNNERLGLILNIKAKVRHQQKQCSNGCIYCNPDLGPDPFPNFTFDIHLKEPEGNA